MTTHDAPVRSIATAPSRVAREAEARRRRPWLVFSIIIVLAFFGLIGGRISLDQSAFTVDRLEDQIATEQARHMDLELEIAELRNPERIATGAAAMGMTYPERQVPLAVAVVESDPHTDVDRWAELSALLGAQP